MICLFSRKSLSILTAVALLATGLAYGESSHVSSHVSFKDEKNECRNSCKKLRRIERKLKKLSHEAPRQINQKKIDKNGGTFVLSHSGDYCVTENIVGALVIGADSVCLDLCCHTLNANGRANAIVANGHQALKIFDGQIINSTDAAILVANSSDVELYDLAMNNHALDAIRQEDSTNLSVHDVTFLNPNRGERALLFDTCDNIAINRCQASGFLSTIGAIIQLDSCNGASIQDVDVCNNTKSQPAPVGSFDTSAAFVNSNSCTGIDLFHVKVNDNIINTTAVGNRRLNAIGFAFSNSCSMLRCETSNNVDISGDVGNDLTLPVSALDRQVFIGLSDNVNVTEHQANNNRCTQPIVSFRMFNTRDSNNTVFEGCQANSNFVQELAVSTVFFSEFEGFKTQFASIPAEGCAFRNCQANFNSAANGGAGRDPLIGNFAFLNGIEMQGSSIAEGCQGSHNFMENSHPLPLTFVGGIVAVNASNISIRDSSADNNAGAEFSVGINIAGVDQADSFNYSVLNCSGSSNGNYGLLVGNLVDTVDFQTFNIAIVDSVFNANGNHNSDAAGIRVLPLTLNAFNILIKGCQIYDTFSGRGHAAGIKVSNASNVVIEDSNIFNTTSNRFKGHGILFDTLTDSKIIRTQLHGNQNSGVELVGNNSNLSIIESLAIENQIGFNFTSGSTALCGLVQDSRAINNTAAGFKYAITPALTVTFIGNEAQCNGKNANDNYKGLAGLINLQELKLSDGSLTSINPAGAGAAALGARFTNLRVVP